MKLRIYGRKMFLGLFTSLGQRKILSPHEESNLKPSDSTPRCYEFAFGCSGTEPQRLYGLATGHYWVHF